MRDAVATFYEILNGHLTDDDVASWGVLDGFFGLVRRLSRYPEIGAWLDFKAALASEFVGEVRVALDAATPSGRRYELVPNAFSPPLTLASGFDFLRMSPYCDGASVKLYTMHWPMILNFWARELLDANPKLKNQENLVRMLVALFDIPPDSGTAIEPTLANYRYPEPDEAHPVGSEALRRKLRQAKSEAAGAMRVYALAHGYGPVDDFRRRLAVAWESADGVWINRYAYLSDAKLKAIGEVCV
jgi:hypothetical protein